MLKKIFLSFSLMLAFAWTTYADKVLVENIFSDIDKNYEYREELQKLYDRGMIIPDGSGKFSPKAYLNRDEFVGISMEVICERCIQPHTEYKFLSEYTGKDVYFDIDEKNPYFYCVAEADAKKYVRWYDAGESCQNGTNKFGARPFCPVNRINREEAVAVLLRNSGIFTIADNQNIISQIYAGTITRKLWKDVNPTDKDGNPYTFYGYIQKALEYEIVDYDSEWKSKTLKLLYPDAAWNIKPDEHITKEEFLRMSYIALKSNSCKDVVDNGLALRLDVFDKTCSKNQTWCSLSNLQDPENTYDFKPEVETTCESWVDDPTWYIWRFQNLHTGEQIIKSGSYIDDYTFLSSGEWRVYVRVIDACWNTSEVYVTIFVSETPQDIKDISLNVWIEANPIFGPESLLVDFGALVSWWKPEYTYEWDFWDGSTGYGKNIDHLYTSEWTYTVTLTVTDSYWNTWTATAVIQVTPNKDKCLVDSDGDFVVDCDDLCPTIKWNPWNKWCPFLETPCSWNQCSCPEWYTCSDRDPLTCSTGACIPNIPVRASCLYTPWKWSIFGWAVCSTCPCNTRLDFLADIRKCDLVFPAITSPRGDTIYSRWVIKQVY